MSHTVNLLLRQRIRQQQHVAALGTLALRAEDSVPELLDAAARFAADGLGAPLAKVLEHLPRENALLIRAGVGWRDGVVGVVRLPMTSPAGHALLTGTPIISNHLSAETRFCTPPVMAEHGVKRAINVIIAGDADPFGVLEADSRDPGDFDADDAAFLQALAHTLGHALERERDRRRLQAALAEKDLLMQEVHHRVRNSLQIVQSILSLQSRGKDVGEGSAGVLRDAGRRVATIAAVHDRLYRDGAGLSVRIADYLAGLVQDLATSLGVAAAGRTLVLEADAATWPAAEVAPLGIILAELVTNALKHGAGPIRVRFEAPADGPARLIVGDDGAGPPGNFDPAASLGLGMRLILGLLRNRQGSLALETAATGGVEFVVSFGRAP